MSQLGFIQSQLLPRQLLLASERTKRPAQWRCGPPAKVANYSVAKIVTQPVPGQKCGTSGMRVTTRTVLEIDNFIENWVQSLFNALDQNRLKGSTIALGGDGRFLNREVALTVIQIAAANGVGKVLLGQGAFMSTPALSALIRDTDAYIGIIMTASHNPGGIEGDWGVKFNTETGSPAMEDLTDSVYEETSKICSYLSAQDLKADLDSLGATTFKRPGHPDFIVEVINPVDNYLSLLRTVFDMDAIRRLIARPDFSFKFDAMHAITGCYARRIFVDELGAPDSCLLNAIPSPDFDGGHPDPNLTYAAELVKLLDPKMNKDAPQFGAASDGDGDRNMILGRGFFVTPSDSVALIAAYAEQCIPFFRDGLKGLARSMPSSAALDRLAAARGIPCYETPTGWKYFGNLMDDGRISLCGEESFGTGSSHIREKDGIWAVLAWLSILAHKNQDPDANFIGVEEIVQEHWNEFGRNFYCRCDYEQVEAELANKMVQHLEAQIVEGAEPGSGIHAFNHFNYTDPVDGSVSLKQGIRVLFEDGSRAIFRLSGTGSTGATIRLYLERYVDPSGDTQADSKGVIEDVLQRALDISQLEHFTGRKAPTVIT